MIFIFRRTLNKEKTSIRHQGLLYLAKQKKVLALNESKETGSGEDTGQLTQEMIEDMLKSSAELELDSAEADIEDVSSRFADNMFKEAGVNSSQKPSETGQGSIAHIEESPNAINDDHPETFLYDEWDFRADDYKPNWCLVRQKTMPEGDPSYFVDTLNSYGPLATEIKRQFEMLLPEMFRKVRKLDDGEEIDIDDVIEAVVDIKTGASPSEKLYWKRNKVQRDVAVVFLLDTSASKAEAIEEENFNKFTSEIYLKGYLICYVEALKLDPDQIIEEYIKLYRNNFEAVKDRNVF